MPAAASAPDARDAFIRQLPDRILAIQENWKNLAHGRWDSGGLSTLYDRLRELAELCRRHAVSQVGESLSSLESYFSTFVGSQDRPSLGQLSEIDGLLRALRAAAGAARAALPAAPVDSVAVFLLTRDPNGMADLAEALRETTCETVTFSETDDLVAAVSEATPQAIVADTALLPQLPPLSATLIRLATHHEIRIPLVFISNSNALELRVEAMRAGGTAYFVRPFDSRAVAAQIRGLARPKQEAPFRVLIVDDDRYQADFAATILRKAGMETSIVNEPLRVMDSLREFDPELILMDIYMPEVDGIELTSIIREETDFVAVPIVFLSGEQNPDKQLSALSVGGDDFITKPISPKHLVSIVTNRIRRARAMHRAERLHQAEDIDRLGRLVRERVFFDRIAKAIDSERPPTEAQGLLCVELDQATRLREQIGIGGVDSVVAQLGNVLVGELGPQDIMAKLGDTRFGVFVRRAAESDVAALGERLCQRVAAHRFDSAPDVKGITLSTGICLVDDSVEDPSGLVTRASVACASAADAGGNRMSYYRQEDTDSQRRLATVELSTQLRKALADDRFEPQFQAMLDVSNSTRDHFEMTLRLRGPEGDPVDADLIRSTAAHAVLLDRLDRLAVEKALGVLAERRRQGHETYLFLGLSGLTATDANFATWLSARLRARQLVGTGLVLEFRLPEISDHMSSARTVIGALKDMGVAVGLSRFPDKPVAIKVLRFLQADYVRLGEALTAGDLAPVESVVKEVHAAGAKVIVDGIDDPRELDKHWSAGADLLQGSFIQRPADTLGSRFEQAVM
jgi:PleD family two-component response regulator/EAL domain-containing protein (putative c-di-GMP-specific phosphodiesterase class I)